VLSTAAGLMEIRGQAERDSGIGLKLFGFIAESVFTFIPECCSRSSQNSVRNHPGIAFTFPRIPHQPLVSVFHVLRRVLSKRSIMSSVASSTSTIPATSPGYCLVNTRTLWE
jgi:hypothetical protein